MRTAQLGVVPWGMGRVTRSQPTRGLLAITGNSEQTLQGILLSQLIGIKRAVIWGHGTSYWNTVPITRRTRHLAGRLLFWQMQQREAGVSGLRQLIIRTITSI